MLYKIKNFKILNKGIIKKIKDKIYFKFISPRLESKTDKYRGEILNKIELIFKNCQWCLGSGSLLRFYRDNTMEGQDLDIYILSTDFEIVKNNMFENGFYLKQVFYDKNDKIYEYKFEYKNVEVDIFMVYKVKNEYYYGFTLESINSNGLTKTIKKNTMTITGNEYILYYKKIFGFTEIKKYNYRNFCFFGPQNIPLMLEGMYGSGWKVYDPKYDPRIGPSNNIPLQKKGSKSILFLKAIDNYEFDKEKK